MISKIVGVYNWNVVKVFPESPYKARRVSGGKTNQRHLGKKAVKCQREQLQMPFPKTQVQHQPQIVKQGIQDLLVVQMCDV